MSYLSFHFASFISDLPLCEAMVTFCFCLFVSSKLYRSYEWTQRHLANAHRHWHFFLSLSLGWHFLSETTLYVIAGLWANVTNYPVATGDSKTWWWWEENKHIAHVSSIRRVYVNEISMIYWKTDFRNKLLKNRLRWSYIAEANNGSGTGPLEIWLRISNWPG